MHGPLAVNPYRRAWRCSANSVKSEINSFVLPLLLAPKTANSLRSYSWACRAPSLKTARGAPIFRAS